jgi:hypothetical protein
MISLDELLTMSDLSRKSDWFEALKSNTTALGCDGVLFAFKPNSSTDNNQAIILSDYPAAWRKTYDTEHYARIDPVVAHCLTSTVPIVWFDNIYTSEFQGRSKKSRPDARCELAGARRRWPGGNAQRPTRSGPGASTQIPFGADASQPDPYSRLRSRYAPEVDRQRGGR